MIYVLHGVKGYAECLFESGGCQIDSTAKGDVLAPAGDI